MRGVLGDEAISGTVINHHAVKIDLCIDQGVVKAVAKGDREA